MSYTLKTYSTEEKLQILADAAKYDVACTSSGVDRRGKKGALGNSCAAGVCHSFAADGRCISLLKILYSNDCCYDCKYCLSRCSNDVARATFDPDELCQLTIEFYKRNYIEGLFLSSAVVKNPAFTMERMCETLLLLRMKYHFNGYVHVKTIPGAPDDLIELAGYLADRISINMELPTEEGLKKLAPSKSQKTIFNAMGKLTDTISAHRLAIGKDARMERSGINRHLTNSIFNKDNLLSEDILHRIGNNSLPAVVGDTRFKRSFAPAGQSTQMIIGATDETDLALLQTTQKLYQVYDLKRVFFSAYIPLNNDPALPAPGTPVPLLREHRLYQADWLLRYYGFRTDELLSTENPFFNEVVDPKCDWALRHLESFPVDLQTASYDIILRVPGIGPKSAKRIVAARKYESLTYEGLKRMGVVLKRAHYFILINGRQMYKTPIEQNYILNRLAGDNETENWEIAHQNEEYRQMSIWEYLSGSVGNRKICT
ncbi:MAG: putative DNA modification/repair radical SAM protein [Lachnospiraceae bacterium]|nr:putative DNA modification/repair radical SAM protein [Lachnospiraceae bacterium]